jgi:hypothetical protein
MPTTQLLCVAEKFCSIGVLYLSNCYLFYLIYRINHKSITKNNKDNIIVRNTSKNLLSFIQLQIAFGQYLFSQEVHFLIRRLKITRIFKMGIQNHIMFRPGRFMSWSLLIIFSIKQIIKYKDIIHQIPGIHIIITNIIIIQMNDNIKSVLDNLFSCEKKKT